MGWLRWLGRVLAGCLLVVLLLPILAGWPSALLDRGPVGSLRVSAFPLALTLFDPFVWICARNSLLVASATAGLSLVLGVGLGWIAGLGRSWAGAPLRALLVAPLAAGPVLIAASFAWAVGGQAGWDWLAGKALFGESAEGIVRWAALVWTGVGWGVPLVALATLAELRRVDPSWTEAALAVGASRRRAWWDVVWPNLRPGVAGASALVFTLALLEPGGPLVFELERTLAVQIIRAVSRFDQPTHASTLALLATALALAGRWVIGRWGGIARSRFERPVVGTAHSFDARRSSAWLLLLATWCGICTGPVVLWLWRGIKVARAAKAESASNPFAGWLADPELATWVGNSVLTSGLAVAVDLIILRFLFSSRPSVGSRTVRLSCRVFEAIPPLALGAWLLAIPWILLGLADLIEGPTARGFRWLALELSPGRSPGWLLILALAVGQLPMLAGVASLTRGLIRPSRVDASRLMGESDARATRAGGRAWFGVVPFAPAFLAFALAATSLSPARLLTPYSERRTLAPAILNMVLEPGPINAHALGPIAALLGLNLVAFALASRSRLGLPGGGYVRVDLSAMLVRLDRSPSFGPGEPPR